MRAMTLDVHVSLNEAIHMDWEASLLEMFSPAVTDGEERGGKE
jgi:hypothetical protein